MQSTTALDGWLTNCPSFPPTLIRPSQKSFVIIFSLPSFLCIAPTSVSHLREAPHKHLLLKLPYSLKLPIFLYPFIINAYYVYARMDKEAGGGQAGMPVVMGDPCWQGFLYYTPPLYLITINISREGGARLLTWGGKKSTGACYGKWSSVSHPPVSLALSSSGLAWSGLMRMLSLCTLAGFHPELLSFLGCFFCSDCRVRALHIIVTMTSIRLTASTMSGGLDLISIRLYL